MPGNFYSETPADELRRVKAELSRERALCAGLVEALRPFAKALDEYGDDCPLEPDRSDIWEHGLAMCITLGDFRRARSALSELEKSK